MHGALSPSLKAVGREEDLQTWIDARTNIADASETIWNAETEEEGGTAEQLYTACLDVLTDLHKIFAQSRFYEAPTCCATVSQATSGLPLLDDSKEHHLILGDGSSTPQLYNSLNGLQKNNGNAMVAVGKPDECLKCDCKVASANIVKHTNRCIGNELMIHNIRAGADDDGTPDSICTRRNLPDSSQWDHVSGTIARLKSSGKRSIKEALGKLFLWGEDLMDGELDRALRESDELRDHVLELLCGIAIILRRRLLPLVAVQPPQGALQRRLQDLDSLMEHSILITSHDCTEVSKSSDDIEAVYFSESDVIYDGGSSKGEISDLETHHYRVLDIGKELKFRTQCLMDLLPTLEQNIALVESRHCKSSIPAVTPFSVSTPAHTYVSLLRDKYGNAEESLIKRLGEANWQRHIFVRRKMEQIADRPKHEPWPTLEPTNTLEENVTIFHDSGIGTTISGPSQYVASAASHTSFISSLAEGEKGSMRVPQTPKEISAGESFCCNFCGFLQSGMRNRVDWKMHVFADIRPYICTFSSCTDELTAFPTRQLWAEHEFSKHRIDTIWICPECKGEYPSTKALEDHLDESRGCVFSESKRSMLVSMAHRTRQKPIKDQNCPLCLAAPSTTRRAFISHLAQHMEQIALLALPRETETDSDDDSEETSKSFKSDDVTKATRLPISPRLELVDGPDIFPRPPVCPTCSRVFYRTDNMHRHARSHNPGAQRIDCPPPGCRPPGCPYTGPKEFLRSDKLTSHLQNRHQ